MDLELLDNLDRLEVELDLGQSLRHWMMRLRLSGRANGVVDPHTPVNRVVLMDPRRVLEESKARGDSRVGWVVNQEASLKAIRDSEFYRYVSWRNVLE